ncbi:hypothetical protein J6P59_06565 [bacterium]|nr:hypothetical protein [bacterium]
MNKADKSISNIDVALRRRFNFIEEPVDPEKVNNETLRKVLEKINDQLIKLQKSTDLLIGQAYFINKTINDLPNILNDKIIPLLYEYFDDDNDVKKKVKGIIDEVVKIDNVGCKVVDNLYGRIKVEKNN